ncbi:hypothetical protein GGI05_003079 [Coemansia sp. RSA 2603]|nr:hypothetical protein GGI05_003079 [Coemansia sp. RSA 2603]
MHSVARRVSIPLFNSAYLRRQLWIAATSTSPSLTTAVQKCATHIQKVLHNQSNAKPSPEKHQQSPGSCFILVSQSYPARDVEQVVSRLRNQLGNIGTNMRIAGTAVDQVFSEGGNTSKSGLSVLYHATDPSSNDSGSLRAIPFYIGDMHGRQRLREAAVGRWHNSITDRFNDHRSRIRWIDGHSSVTQAASHIQLPPELGDAVANPSSVELILMAADRESRQVADVLDSHFPMAYKLGIVGSQTPFLNGREYTILGDDEVCSSGVIGFVFVRSRGKTVPASTDEATNCLRVRYPNLEAISDTLQIKRSKGNVVLEVENGEAARTLIANIRKRQIDAGSAFDNRLFARISTNADNSDSAVLQVTGGDPAKGGLAIDTTRDIEQGYFIQFMMATDSRQLDLASRDDFGQMSARSSGEIHIMFGAQDHQNETTQDEPQNQSVASIFGGVTEGGFVYGGGSLHTERTRKLFSGQVLECAVPGSTLEFTLGIH